MIRLFSIITVLIISVNCFGQKNNLAKIPPQASTKKEDEREVLNHNCMRTSTQSFKNRIKNYPFNKATQIQLVSFEGSIDSTQDKIVRVHDRLPTLNDTVCYSKLREVKAIDFSNVDKLTDVLFNFGFRGPVYTMSISLCYSPRNAILFLDSAGKTFEYIEICFDCDQVRASSTEMLLGDMCDQKMDMLKDIFKKNKIEYGVTNGRLIDGD